MISISVRSIHSHSKRGEQMSQDNLNPGKYGENSSQLAEQSEAHDHKASNIPNPPHEPHHSKSGQKPEIVSEISRYRACVEITVITIGVIGLLWTGTALLYYIAGGMVAFIGFLVSGILSLSTFIGIFWPVFLKNVWTFLRNRHSKRWTLFGRVLTGSFGIAVLLFWVIVSFVFDPYHHLGWPVLNTQLSSNDDYWHPAINQMYGECNFEQASYHVTAYSGFFHYCVATATDYTNFVYEVQMTVIQGNCGGLVFRANYANDKEYLFYICKDGTYCLERWDSLSISHDLLGCNANPESGNLPQILRETSGTAKPITLAVVARGHNFELWVNYHELDVGFDSSDQELKEGQIGVAAVGFDTPYYIQPEVSFNNAKVWKLYGG